MARVVWTSTALQDVARLYRFLAPKDRDAARRAARTIRRGVRVLARHPGIGRPYEASDPALREWFVPFGSGGYVVSYRSDGGLVVLLTIRHGREAGD